MISEAIKEGLGRDQLFVAAVWPARIFAHLAPVAQIDSLANKIWKEKLRYSIRSTFTRNLIDFTSTKPRQSCNQKENVFTAFML